MKKILALITALLLIVFAASCSFGQDASSGSESSRSQSSTGGEKYPEVSAGSAPDDISAADLDDMDFSFSDRDKEEGYRENEIENPKPVENGYELTAEGTYIFSGEIIDKTITVNAGDNDKVQIVLDNATIRNTNGPAIYIANADKVFITLANGSESTVSDGSDYTVSDSKSELDAAIFSRADLTVNGEGSLTVNGNYKHGIVSKDDLRIVGISLTVNARKVGLNGKDCVKISGADIDVTAGSDGIRSDNDEDADRGFVYIESGSIKIVSENDGIQAETAVKIDTAKIDITAGGGSKGTLTNADESYKGIKAVSDILILGGNFRISSLDDALHSNNTVTVSGGIFELSTRDDGIHADIDLAISNGIIKVTESYEGLEATRIFITGGKIDITASDDGLNAAGGNDQSGGGNPFGQGGFGQRPPSQKPGGFGNDPFGAGGNGEINISGGYIHIDASGDGIDANGNIAVSGGTVLVSGPTNNGNGAFDYDGSATVTGGILIAAGSSGMAQNFSTAENQGAMLVNTSTQSAGTSLVLCDKDGNAIVSFTPDKTYQCVVITAPEIQQGEKYSLYVKATVNGADENGFAHNTSCSGGTSVQTVTMSSLLYGSGGFNPGGGDHGGGPGGRR